MLITKVTEENVIEVLSNMFPLDEDFIGNNGADFTTKEAVDAGFTSDAKYFAKRSFDRHAESMNLEAMIYEMGGHFERLHGHFWNIDLDTAIIDDSLILAVSAKQKE